MIKELAWEVTVRGTIYAITLIADTLKHTENKISKMYGLDLSGIAYVLAILTDGTYRLYSKAQRKFYIKGRSDTLSFLPVVKVTETIH